MYNSEFIQFVWLFEVWLFCEYFVIEFGCRFVQMLAVGDIGTLWLQDLCNKNFKN